MWMDLTSSDGSVPAASLTSPAKSSISTSSATTTPISNGSRTHGEGHTPASDGIKSKLLSHVENRPDREQLMKRNIIKAYDHNTDPKLQGVMSSLIKTQTEDRLAQSLNKRRSVQELVAQGILMDRTKGTVTVQLAQRALLRQMERDRLSAFLTKRPTLDELVKTKQNIMEDTMTWIRCATMTGSIPLPRNCLSEDSRVLTESGFMFLDEIKACKVAPKYACYNPETQGVEYLHGELFEKEYGGWPMIEFTPEQERSHWNYNSDLDEHCQSDEEESSAAASSNSHVSLLVTADHDMYVQFGTRSNDTTVADQWFRHTTSSSQFNKVPASSLLSSSTSNCSCLPPRCTCSSPHSSIRMLSCAARGVTRAPEVIAEFKHLMADEFSLQSDLQISAFLRLYGYWLGHSGHLDHQSICFAIQSHQDESFILTQLSSLNLAEGCDWTSSKLDHSRQFQIFNPSWFNYFHRHYHSTPSTSFDCFSWILTHLSAAQSQQLFRGLRQQNCDSPRILTASTVLRDQLIQVCLQAGYSAWFERKSTKTVDPPSDMWQIHYLDPFSPASSNLSKLDATSPTPSFHRSKDIRPISSYRGRVWCVTVPTGLIFIQRAMRNKAGVVTKASRPIISGNCHTMNSFPGTSKLYLLGGYGTGSTTNSDLLILDTSNDTWIRPPIGGSIPCERYSHTCSSLGNGKLVVFGGFSTNGVWLNDVYVLDTQVAQSFYTKYVPPSASASASVSQQHSAHNSQRNSPATMRPQHSPTNLISPTHATTSGMNGNLSTSSPIFQPQAHPQYPASSQPHSPHLHSPNSGSQQLSTISMLMWQQPLITGQPPAPRAAHSAVVVGDKIWIFGGNDGETLFNDLHILDTVNWSWSVPQMQGTLPPPRAGHTMNLINGRHIVIFGGGTAAGPVNDLFILDTASTDPLGFTWTKPKLVGTPPSPRAGHTACNFFANQLLVFGGGYLNKVFNDLHLFNFDTCVWSRPADTGTVPTPRAGHSSNVLDARIYVFAGGDSEHVYNDVHILDTAFLRIQQQQAQQAAAYQFQSVVSNHQGVQSKGELMSTLNLGPSSSALTNTTGQLLLGTTNVKGKSQSAPNSPVRRPMKATELESLKTTDSAHPSEASSSSPPHSLDSLELSGAMAKLLSAQVRERDEYDATLLLRFDATQERIQHHLTNLAAIIAADFPTDNARQSKLLPLEPLDGRESSLMKALMRTVRQHRLIQEQQVKDVLLETQKAIQQELNDLRGLITSQRHGLADEPSFHSRHGSSVGMNNSLPVGGGTVLQSLSASQPHAHSVPQSPYSSTTHASRQAHPEYNPAGHGIMLGPSIHPLPASVGSDGPLIPSIYRSTSADDVPNAHGHHQHQSTSSQRSISSNNGIISSSGARIKPGSGMPPSIGTLTVKAVSVTSNSSSSLNSPASGIISNSLAPLAPGPPGSATPNKKRARKRGGHMVGRRSSKKLDEAPGQGDDSNQSTPILSPMNGANSNLSSGSHASKMSVSSTNSNVTSLSSTSSTTGGTTSAANSDTTSPLHLTHSGSDETISANQPTPTRQSTPDTPNSETSQP